VRNEKAAAQWTLEREILGQLKKAQAAEFEQRLNDLAGERTAALAQKEAEIAVCKGSYEQEIAQIKDHYDAQISKHATERDHLVTEMCAERDAFAEAKARVDAKHHEQLADVTAKSDELIAAIRTEAGQARVEMDRERARLLAEKERALADAAERQRALLSGKEAEIAALQSRYERELLLNAKQAQETLSQLQAQLQQAEEAAAAAAAKAADLAATAATEHARVLSETRAQFELEKSEHECALAALSAEWDNAVSGKDADIAALRTECEGKDRQADHALSEAKLRQAESEMQGRVAAQLEEDIARYRARIKAVLEERDGLAEAISQLQAEHASEVAQIVADGQKKMNAASRRQNSETKERESLRIARQEAEKATALLRDEYAGQIERLKAEQQAQMANLAAELQQERALRKLKEQMLDAMNAKWEPAMQTLQRELFALRANRERSTGNGSANPTTGNEGADKIVSFNSAA
jgi:hypothetical protein